MFWKAYFPILILAYCSDVDASKCTDPYLFGNLALCQEETDKQPQTRLTLHQNLHNLIVMAYDNHEYKVKNLPRNPVTPKNELYQPEVLSRFQPNYESRPLMKDVQRPLTRPNERPTQKPIERITQRAYTKHNNFNSNIFYIISHSNLQRNVVFSPYLVKTLLGMMYMGADGETSYEIQNAVSLPNDKREAAENFRHEIQNQANSPDIKLQTANKLFYADQKGTVLGDFQRVIRNYFSGEVEGISFEEPQRAAGIINNWVSSRTENRINNLISPETLSWDTSAVLLNAVYFKAKWAKPFSTKDTMDHEFINHLGQNRPVPMMFMDDVFEYAEIPQIQARMVELPYLGSNTSMIIILPDKLNGLKDVEDLLKDHSLDYIFSLLKRYEMKVRIPKFKIQFDIDLEDPLQRLGVTKVFTDNAELPGIIQGENLKVSKMQQKAVLDVNEAGSEAAVSSFAHFVPLTLAAQQKIFTADHPFIFLIKSMNEILFIGHYVGP